MNATQSPQVTASQLALRAYTDDYASTAVLTLTITPDNLKALCHHVRSTLELVRQNRIPINTITTPNPIPARLHWTDDETQDSIREQSHLATNPDEESILGLLPVHHPALEPTELDITFRLHHQEIAIFNTQDPTISFWVTNDHEPLTYRTTAVPLEFLDNLQEQLNPRKATR